MNLHDFDIKKEAFENGKQAGAQQKAVEAAKNALGMNLSAGQVAEITGLSLEKINDLISELRK